MYLIFFIFIAILLIGYLMYIKPATAFLVFDTDSSDFNLRVKWLYPLIEAKVEMVEYSPFLTVMLFKKKVFARAIKPKKKQKQPISQYYRSLDLNDIFARIYYSLNDPFSTGITSGIFQIVQLYLNNITIEQYPNFIANHAYITFHFGAKLNILKSAAKIIRIKYFNKTKRRTQYGAI